MSEVGRIGGNVFLLRDPLSFPCVLERRIGGSPDFDRFVVSHGRKKTQGIAYPRNERERERLKKEDGIVLKLFITKNK